MIFTCVIPASKKDAESQMLKDLIRSIRDQDFPQDQIEILVITEGDSEQAKAIGIKRAKGEICAMFCADNMIMKNNLFKTAKKCFEIFKNASAFYPERYAYVRNDNSLNRYFSLIGGNDPVCYYLGKNDRISHVKELIRKSSYQPSYGCNGFFYRTEHIKKTNLDHYYPMDNAMEVPGSIIPISSSAIWHRTSDNLITFLKKRYKYARDLYSQRADRRWKMVDSTEDYMRLIYFVVSTIAILPCLWISIRGCHKIRDWAWFWHWPVCFGFLIVYTWLTINTFLSRLLSQQWKAALRPCEPL